MASKKKKDCALSGCRVRPCDPQDSVLKLFHIPDHEPTSEEERIERECLEEFDRLLLALIRRVVEILVGDASTAMYALSERGETLREIAEDFDCSHETVRRRLQQIKRHLDSQ